MTYRNTITLLDLAALIFLGIPNPSLNWVLGKKGKLGFTTELEQKAELQC